ncbi:uncharacterized protein LOC143295478 [Babylonia areolata]|uniref:uncharacterized protein LOC143295478 n=1 Tax=Babylonia areolata TaxID=304850 RepID=UPI003FD1C152
MVFLLPRCLLLGVCYGGVFGVGVSSSDTLLSDVIELEVVTSTSGTVVHEAPSFSEVLLRVSFTDGQTHGDISLFDCVAVSDVGSHEIKLTDFTGCPARKSPMGCMVEENDLLVSPAFELSSLAEHGDVNITCSWEMCSTPHHPKCKNRCDFFTKLAGGGRRRRQSRDEHVRSASHTISTRIRVLPSHVRHRHHHGGGSSPSSFNMHGMHGAGSSIQPGMSQPARAPSQNVYPPHHQDGMMVAYPTLMYLNPIICSLFLLILSVFLGLYVTFVRSLSRTVQHIKAEMDRQRLHDKFLVPEYHE